MLAFSPRQTCRRARPGRRTQQTLQRFPRPQWLRYTYPTSTFNQHQWLSRSLLTGSMVICQSPNAGRSKTCRVEGFHALVLRSWSSTQTCSRAWRWPLHLVRSQDGGSANLLTSAFLSYCKELQQIRSTANMYRLSGAARRLGQVDVPKGS